MHCYTAHRLADFCVRLIARVPAEAATALQVAARTLVLAAENDIMIPSAQEAEKLKKLLPVCRSRVLQARGHAVLQEAGIDLMQLLEEEGFLVQTRRMTGSPAASKGKRKAGGFGRHVPGCQLRQTQLTFRMFEDSCRWLAAQRTQTRLVGPVLLF
jgi:hypothetical protein